LHACSAHGDLTLNPEHGNSDFCACLSFVKLTRARTADSGFLVLRRARHNLMVHHSRFGNILGVALLYSEYSENVFDKIFSSYFMRGNSRANPHMAIMIAHGCEYSNETPSTEIVSHRYKGCRTNLYGPLVTSNRACGKIAKAFPR
jgi:hypothetical protein